MKPDFFSLHRRAQDSIAQAYLTNSKRPQSHVMGVYPTHVKSGYGCRLVDHGGKSYIDFICGLGTNLLGYANDRIATAISAELRNGYNHSFATHHEVETAEKAKELFPFVDCFKFLKSGSEACSAAIRIARAKTGRKLVLSDGYHGHHDHFVSLTAPALGTMPSDMLGMKPLSLYEDSPFFEEAAAVIVEPVITDWSDARRAYLQELREKCTKHGVMLIFDEVITGLRFPRFSVSAFWDITPDIIVLGKALGGGLSLAAVGGKYAVMNGAEYFISSTYAGETLAHAAGKMAMTLLQTKFDLNQLWDKGQKFLDQFNSLWPEKIRIEGYPTRGAFKGDDLVKALFFQECCKAHILFGPSWFYNFHLADETPGVLQVCRDVIIRIQHGKVALEGEMPMSPFAEKVRAGNASAKGA
jgi:glutamate-1-semialdehyde 2,1-aminomutase